MLKLTSSGGGFPGICGRMCDRCYASVSEIYCLTDSAFLCQNCNELVHAVNPIALQHKQVVVCTACMNAPAAFTCQADAASLCVNCDIEIHSANPLAQRHKRVPIVPIPVLGFSPPLDNLEPFQDDMLVSVGKLATDKEEPAEDETDSWLLLDLDSNDSQAMSLFNYFEEEDRSVNPAQHHQQYFTGHQGDSGGSSICQIEPSESNEQQGDQRQMQEQQHQCQRKDVYREEMKGFIQDTEYTSMINTQSELTAESETDCSFLLNFDYDDNQATGGYYQKEVDDYLDLTDYGPPAKDPSDLWQDFIIHDGNNDSDHIVPVQSCTAQQHQPLQTYEISERQRAYMPSSNGYFIKTKDAYPKPCGRDFPDPSLLMPMQFTAMNRAESLLRYKEKRKARKFEKKIRYTSRKVNAENRPRVKGRFANCKDRRAEC